MSGVFKGIKKVFKGVAKVVKKVVKGVVKLGKNIVKGVGKVMGKLGPIGTIAIGFLAPYAIGAMAGMGGWVGAIGKGLQAVSSAVAAPFKMAGQVLGKGISTLGSGIAKALPETLSQGFTSITDKVTNFLGYQGGDVATGVKNIANAAGKQWDDFFGTSFSTGSKLAEVAPTIQAPKLEFFGGESGSLLDKFSGAMPDTIPATPGLGEQLASVPTPSLYANADTNAFFQKPAFDSRMLEAMQPATQSPYEEVLSQSPDSFKPTTSTDSLKKLANAFGGLPTPSPMAQLPAISTEGYNLQSAQVGKAGGPGGTGTSFWAQEQTGLLRTEDFAQQAYSLLNRAYG